MRIGIVSFEKDNKGGDNVVVTNPETGESFEKLMVYGSTLKVSRRATTSPRAP